MSNSDAVIVPTLSIITVTYNSVNEITNFIASLEYQGIDYETWFVDNASADGTTDMLKSLQTKNKRISVLCNDKNVGLAAANNQPIDQLKSTYVAIVNPDVVLHSNALAFLVQFLESHQDVVAVAPVNVDLDGEPHSSFHRAWGLRHLLIWRLLPARLTNWIYSKVRHFDEQDVLFASGACIVMRTKDFVEIGGYDPEYFLTVEDVCDLCIRLRRGSSKKRVVVTPNARITHLKSRSAVTVPFVTLWQGARGSIYHFRKHYGLVAGWMAFIIVFTSIFVRTVFSLFRAPFNSQYKKSFYNNSRVLGFLFRNNPLYAKVR